MAGASAALIVVYALAVLFLLASVGYGYVAWRNYRRAMSEALQRRRERSTERVTQDNYWIGEPPPPSSSAHGAPFGYSPVVVTVEDPHAVAVRVYSPSFKATSVSTSTPLRSHRGSGA